MPTKPKSLLNPIQHVNTMLLSDLAAEQIISLIQSGQLAAGSRIPAERDLAQQLAVSRTAVREALRIVEATGVVESRVGRGRFVRSRPARSAGRTGMSTWEQLHSEEAAELAHVVQLIEPVSVLEVPIHLLPEVVVEARSIYERAALAVEAGDADLASALDGDFHRSLSVRTPNRLLRAIVLQLVEMMGPSARVVYSVPAAANRSLAHHLEIISALEAGDRNQASLLVRDHAAIAHRFAAEQSNSYETKSRLERGQPTAGRTTPSESSPSKGSAAKTARGSRRATPATSTR
jgi:GntR family transcriptional repressor for pyruvate dehydrogenase complex